MSRRFEVTPGFLLLLLWFARVNGWQLLVTVLLAAAVHESGHYLALRGLGASVSGIRLCALGMVMRVSNRRLSYGGELLALLAGPLANLLAAWLLCRTGKMTAAGAHLVLGAFNLLPLWPLDGGRGLYLAVSWLAGPEAGWQAARWAGSCTAAGLAGGLLYVMYRTGGSLWLAPAVCGALGALWRNVLGNLRD